MAGDVSDDTSFLPLEAETVDETVWAETTLVAGEAERGGCELEPELALVVVLVLESEAARACVGENEYGES